MLLAHDVEEFVGKWRNKLRTNDKAVLKKAML
jgi:hypothetical protein